MNGNYGHWEEDERDEEAAEKFTEEETAEEALFCDFLRRLAKNIPENAVWIADPVRYPAAVRACGRILRAVREEAPDAEAETGFDPLYGTMLYLKITGWAFSFGEAAGFLTAAAGADCFDFLALTNGKAELCFGFRNVRIPIACAGGVDNPPEKR